MKLTATYHAEDRAYTIQVAEQQIVVPASFMNRFVACVEVAMYRQRLAVTNERLRKAQELVEDAHHPAILPFVKAEKPKKGRPKGIHTPKSRLKPQQPPKAPKAPKEPKPPPFKHTTFR